jgi:PilZ domain-containing protein
MERRQADRASVSIVLTEAKRYPASGGFRRISATVRNISASGLLLETGDPLDVDDRLEFNVPLSDGKPPPAVRAIVIRTLVSPARVGVRFAGCRFEGLHATEQSRIRVAMPGLPAGSPFIG